MNTFPFTPEHKTEGKRLLEAGAIKTILFSQGTYQLEVADPNERDAMWPFLQIDDRGQLKDCFCTCQVAEKHSSCSHLSAAFLFLLQDKPFHLRFQDSLWNLLCSFAFHRHGSFPKYRKKGTSKLYQFIDQKKKVWVDLQMTSPKGEDWLHQTLLDRQEETEETSLKFSNLSAEELSLWKEGNPSEKLQYELSFWSDFAKWMFALQKLQAPYKILFLSKEASLPTAMQAVFPHFTATFQIEKKEWETLIPSLKGVDSPLRVDLSDTMHLTKARYQKDKKQLILLFAQEEQTRDKQPSSIKVGKWEFRPGEGFFPEKTAEGSLKKTISAEKMGEFLTNHSTDLQNKLLGTPLHLEPITPSYDLFFDEQGALHISPYAFHPGDLQEKTTSLFLPWIYLEKKGFFQFSPFLFPDLKTIIPKDKIEEFIHQNKVWLNQFPGFQLHLSPIDLHLHYSLDKEKRLSFHATMEQISDNQQTIAFENWLYVQEKGFYRRQGARRGASVSPKITVEPSRISPFIRANKEELEQVKHFFSRRCPIQKASLHITLSEDDIIVITPKYTLHPSYRSRPFELFGEFTYVSGEGFSEIPVEYRLPEKYQKELAIEDHKDSIFITRELPKLAPFIEYLDPRLEKPRALTLQVKEIQKPSKHSLRSWTIHLAYVSEIGDEPLYTIKTSFDKQEPYATTRAGLLFLDDPRFHWLANLSLSQFTKDKKYLELSTIEWIRLRIFEKVTLPNNNAQMTQSTRELIEAFDQFKVEEKLDLKGLKSSLRPYQEVGAQWLWFLYSYGLSGLLCDDMGLGKTHQAMALLAAVHNHSKKKPSSYLVVCPTSVLYHWEELLSHFLPKFRTTFFYGSDRSLSSFQKNQGILLTSYGVLRSEKKEFGKLFFEIAIFDEIQMGKNTRSQTHKMLSAIKAHTKIGLTGTPIENRLLELKALFDIVLPGYFPSQAKYKEKFIQPIEKHQDRVKKELLSELIHPFVLRRKKGDVLHDLPEKIEEIAYCSLSTQQQQLYQQACSEAQSFITQEIDRKDEKTSYLHIFSLFNKLKQICNHPALYMKQTENFEDYTSGKWPLFTELIQEAQNSGQKIVIFTQYLGMIEIFKKFFQKKNIQFASIQGETRKRKEELIKFKEDPSCEVFLASLRAVGTGIDLTAASVVIHYDRWWNPARENQATDRVHRIGQNRGVQVFKLVTKGTIEEHIHHLILKKTGLLEGVVGYDDQDQIKRLNHSDLIAILKQIHHSSSTL